MQRAHFEEVVRIAPLQHAVSEAVIWNGREIRRTATIAHRLFWTSGSIYCETSNENERPERLDNENLRPDFLEKMLAQ